MEPKKSRILSHGSGVAWLEHMRHFMPWSGHREQILESAQNHRNAQDTGPRWNGKDSHRRKKGVAAKQRNVQQTVQFRTRLWLLRLWEDESSSQTTSTTWRSVISLFVSQTESSLLQVAYTTTLGDKTVAQETSTEFLCRKTTVLLGWQVFSQLGDLDDVRPWRDFQGSTLRWWQGALCRGWGGQRTEFAHAYLWRGLASRGAGALLQRIRVLRRATRHKRRILGKYSLEYMEIVQEQKAHPLRRLFAKFTENDMEALVKEFSSLEADVGTNELGAIELEQPIPHACSQVAEIDTVTDWFRWSSIPVPRSWFGWRSLRQRRPAEESEESPLGVKDHGLSGSKQTRICCFPQGRDSGIREIYSGTRELDVDRTEFHHRATEWVSKKYSCTGIRKNSNSWTKTVACSEPSSNNWWSTVCHCVAEWRHRPSKEHRDSRMQHPRNHGKPRERDVPGKATRHQSTSSWPMFQRARYYQWLHFVPEGTTSKSLEVTLRFETDCSVLDLRCSTTIMRRIACQRV